MERLIDMDKGNYLKILFSKVIIKVIILIFTLFTLSVSVSAQWQLSKIDTLTDNDLSDWTAKNSLVLDSNELPHIVWYQQGYLFHIHKISEQEWSIPERITDSSFFDMYPDVVIDKKTNVIHFVCTGYDSGHYVIFYGNNQGDKWRLTKISNANTYNRDPSIALDSAGEPHIVFLNRSEIGDPNINIIYKTKKKDHWTSEVVNDTSGIAIANPSIAVSPLGMVHIVYGGVNGSFNHIFRNVESTNWHSKNIQTINDVDYTTSMILDDSSTIHLAITGEDWSRYPKRLFYLYLREGTFVWSLPELVDSLWAGINVSMTIDKNGHMHLVWEEIRGDFIWGNTIYATNVYRVWHVKELLVKGAGSSPSIKIDSRGIAHLAFLAGGYTWPITDRELCYTTSTTPVTRVADHYLKEEQIDQFYLVANYPNPFNARTTIFYRLSHANPKLTTLKIYNIQGKEIVTLINKEQDRGSYGIGWDGFDKHGKEMPSGIYFYRLSQGTQVVVGKMLKIK